ncbi:AbiV family abortive infection protein [Nocardioides pakistanensis]
MAELSLKALANARALFDDATALYERGRIASAFTLVGLAADELGKHVLVTSFYGGRDESDDEWRKFWKRFRHHESKLGDALWGAWAGDLLSEDPPPNVKAFHERRLSATYVDIADDGTVQTPADSITAADVEAALGLVSGEVKFCEEALRGATPETLGRHMESMRTSGIADEFRRLLTDAGPTASMGFVIGMRAGLPPDEALAFARFAEENIKPPQDTRPTPACDADESSRDADRSSGTGFSIGEADAYRS